MACMIFLPVSVISIPVCYHLLPVVDDGVKAPVNVEMNVIPAKLLLLLVLPVAPLAAGNSPYAGEEGRVVKSLSVEETAARRRQSSTGCLPREQSTTIHSRKHCSRSVTCERDCDSYISRLICDRQQSLRRNRFTTTTGCEATRTGRTVVIVASIDSHPASDRVEWSDPSVLPPRKTACSAQL